MPPAFNRAQAIADLHQALGYKPLNRTWAKAELFLGLAMVGIALLAWPAKEIEFVVLQITLFTLGAYLSLAGHRSHLYQSNNELVAYLLHELHRSQHKVEPS